MKNTRFKKKDIKRFFVVLLAITMLVSPSYQSYNVFAAADAVGAGAEETVADDKSEVESGVELDATQDAEQETADVEADIEQEMSQDVGTDGKSETTPDVESEVVPDADQGLDLDMSQDGNANGESEVTSEATQEETSDFSLISALDGVKKFAKKLVPSFLSGGEPIYGSGSYQLNEVATHYRFYTEYYVGHASGKKDTTADIKRRTTIYVYANAGERILFGSSVSDSQIDKNNKFTGHTTNQDIVITTPSGKKVCEDVVLPGKKDTHDNVKPKGYGYIANPTQEKHGPKIDDSVAEDDRYYEPIAYDVDETGVYTFEFHSRTGYNDGTTAKAAKAGDAWDQKNTTVAAWDVTVYDPGATKVKSGRAWADYLALTTGAAGSTNSDLDVHVLTHDGYIYKVDFKEAVPFGFIFFANNTGFMTTINDESGDQTKVPIYHSFYDSTNDLDNMLPGENITLHKPNEDDTSTEETYKIFFNRPNDDLQGITDHKGNEIKTKPDDKVELGPLDFHGIDNNIARAGHGGTFTFTSTGEAVITISLDLRKAILESGITMEEYDGSGIVEITAPIQAGLNTIYWNGKDTEGVTIPSGIYGDSNVVIATEIKRGELHFPVIDMEGLYGGLKVERLNGISTETDEERLKTAFDLYYNNNPLAYGTIEGKEQTRVTKGGYNILSDDTKSYNIDSKKGGLNFFKDYAGSVSTLKKDTKEYLAQKLFNTGYDSLPVESKSIIDAEFGKELATYHFEPVDSRVNTMKFSCSSNEGGGNQAGIDAWTYYTQGREYKVISFAVLDTIDRGVVNGQLFYDGNKDSVYDTSNPVDYPLANTKVRLIDETGKPLVHVESMPCFDSEGHFIYDKDGSIKHELKNVKFETVTDAKGNYRFTGVPYSDERDIDYYVQVMLSDTQSEAMRYACTTSEHLKEKLENKTNGNKFHENSIDVYEYGADGNKIELDTEGIKIYRYRYARAGSDNETVFDVGNTNNIQKVTFSPSNKHTEGPGIRVESFKKIGYCTAVPEEHKKDYKIVKEWGEDSQGHDTHQISDGLTVELWVWNDSEVKEKNELSLTRRTGALMDTQILNDANGWTYTWKNLDDRLQYYVLEYYTKKKDNGEVICNDKHEPRLVLIGGTMPIFSTVPDGNDGYYGFKKNLEDYPEQILDEGDLKIPIQKFENVEKTSAKVHTNSITKQEKLDSVDNNARQYDVTYKAIKEDSGDTNVIYLTNSQIFDDRTYYVWLDHETVLPDLIAQTYVDHTGAVSERGRHSVTLQKDKLLDASKGEYDIKGLSVSSVDAASTANVEGNATDAFRIKDDGKNAIFTATNHGNYKSGTGTRTYQVKYVVKNDADKEPVKIKVDSGKLVRADDTSVEVENNDDYIVYRWYMTIHVYDVKEDGVIEYDPADGNVSLQKALPAGTNLEWKLVHDEKNNNSVTYTSTDKRTEGILQNDTYRVPLYKTAVEADMGSCADVVGIAYAGDSEAQDVSKLDFVDTYDSRYGTRVRAGDQNADGNVDEDCASADGYAAVEGSGGAVNISLNTARNTKINRVQDHANYADITFVPKKQGIMGRAVAPTDVFYYKIVVFAEDSTYSYTDYDDIDATDGVVMYTHFTMKSTAVPPEEDPEPDPEGDPDPGDDSGATPVPGDTPDSGTTPVPGDTPDSGTTPVPGDASTPGGNVTPGDDSSSGGNVTPGDTPTSGDKVTPGDDPTSGGNVIPSDTPTSGDNSSPEDDKSMKDNKTPGDDKLSGDNISAENTSEKNSSANNVLSKQEVSGPKTGDYNNWMIWVSLIVLSVSALVVIGIRRKRVSKKE